MRLRLARLAPAILVAGLLTVGLAANEFAQRAGAGAAARAQSAGRTDRARPSSNYFPSGTGTCASRSGDNVKVNQNCLNLTDQDLNGRGQANNETSIAQDRLHPATSWRATTTTSAGMRPAAPPTASTPGATGTTRRRR